MRKHLTEFDLAKLPNESVSLSPALPFAERKATLANGDTGVAKDLSPGVVGDEQVAGMWVTSSLFFAHPFICGGEKQLLIAVQME